MAIWSKDNTIITNKGLALQAKLLSSDKFEITRVVSGSGRVANGTLINQTAVSNIVQELSVVSLHYDANKNALIRVRLNNIGLTDPYNCHQIGIYAADPDEGEILYMISQEEADGEKIPSISEQPNGFYTDWVFTLKYSNSENISVTIDPANALTQEEADIRYVKIDDVGNSLVRYDEEQNLSDDEKAQARANIGAGTPYTHPSSHSAGIISETEERVFFSPEEREKLKGIAEGATKYTHPTFTPQSSGLYKITIDSNGHVSEVELVKKADITALGIPSNNTQNTAGSTDISKKIYLIGTQTQASYLQTFSHDTVYVGEDGCLYSDGKKVSTYAFKQMDVKYINEEGVYVGKSGGLTATDSADLMYFLQGDNIEIEAFTEENKYPYMKFSVPVDDGASLDDVFLIDLENSKRPMSTRAIFLLIDSVGNLINSNIKAKGNNYNYAPYGLYLGTTPANANDDWWNSLGFGTFMCGYGNETSGDYAVALGSQNTAYTRQTVVGKYADTTSSDKGGCTDSGTDGSLFVVGNGTGDGKRSNAFRVSAAGQCYGLKVFLSSGADFGEYFEWADGNPNGEDRRGRFVTHATGKKIRFANADDDDIIGVVSTIGAFIGNAYTETWQGRYLTDEFGEWLTEKVDVPETTVEREIPKVDKKTGKITTEVVTEVIPAHTETRYITNPDYDPEQEYISREHRKEWSPVGFRGQVVVIDDGSCKVDGYCKPSTDGIATVAETGDRIRYRVIGRIDDTHIEVLVK